MAVFGYGIVPSVMPYAASSYQSIDEILLWGSALGMIADPIARTLSGSLTLASSVSVLPPVFTVAMAAGSLILSMAATSRKLVPAFVPVLAQATFVACFAFVNTSVYLQLRGTQRQDVDGHSLERIQRRYVLSSCATQVGSACGTGMSFLLIVVFKVFVR